MLWTREHAPTPDLSVVFTFKFRVESIKEFGGCVIALSRFHCFNTTRVWCEEWIKKLSRSHKFKEKSTNHICKHISQNGNPQENENLILQTIYEKNGKIDDDNLSPKILGTM